MFKKKTIYIIGIILFTLILIADLAVSFLMPTGGRGNMPNMGSFSGEMPEGFDSESFGGQMSGGNFEFEGEISEDIQGFGGQMPEGGEDFAMPEGGEDFAIPEGGEDFAMPEGGEGSFGGFSGQMPEGFDGSNMPNRGQMNNMGGGGFFSTLRSAFWPILIVCVLGDSLCIFMLIRISRKKGKKQDGPDDDDDADNPPRRDRTNTLLAVIAVLLVGAVALTSLPSGETGGTMEAQASVQEAQATVNDLVGIFSGSGTLSSTTADEVQIPITVSVTSYAVENGDMVQAGDVIANVDKTSVLNAIYEVQSLITEMDAEIAEVQSDTLDNEITARADGRVKAIYVAEGDSIGEAMYENGAVILISLGGSMTVVIESDREVAVGQTLAVTLSDETHIEGKVQQVRDGKITVTTTDNGPAPDDTVSVATEDGILLGTGTLSISSPMKVTGYFGIADKIHVDVGDKVETGDTLITLDDADDLARYQQLLQERKVLSELVSELSAMYQDGTVRASAAGVISDINTDRLREEKAVRGGYGEAGQPVDGTYAGLVTKVSYGALQIRLNENDMTGSTVADVENMEESLFTAAQQFTPDLDVPVSLYLDGQAIPSSVNAIQAGDRVLLQLVNGTVAQIDYVVGTGASGPSQGTTPGDNVQLPSGGSNFGGYRQPVTSEEDEEEAVYEVEKGSVCAITPAETMTVDISVDELDILTLAVGQEAAITLDALPGQSFAGTVKKINTSGTNEGGGTKYTVTMEVPRTEQMLPGMNASVLIEVSRLDSVLTVPAAAVYEDGNRTYVYTALDEKSGEPTNPVDVTTGSSDGTNIEILSGLTSGDAVYYSYADSIVYRFAS